MRKRGRPFKKSKIIKKPAEKEKEARGKIYTRSNNQVI